MSIKLKGLNELRRFIGQTCRGLSSLSVNRLLMTWVVSHGKFLWQRMAGSRRRLDLGGHSRIRFGQFEADLKSRELFCNGLKIPLQEKPFLILSALLQSPQELITREQLALRVWPDSYVEIDFCLNTAVRKLRRALNDSVDHPRFIETVGKLGYRFIGPMSMSEETHSGTPEQPPTTSSCATRPLRLLVLPFEDLGVSPDGVFAEGMTLHIVTRLVAGRHKHLALVFSRRKHDVRNVHQISRELHADYVLTGSVLRSDGRMRIDVELIDQTDQSCVWAETYTRAQSDFIVIQDDIAQHLSRSLMRILPHAERAGRVSAD